MANEKINQFESRITKFEDLYLRMTMITQKFRQGAVSDSEIMTAYFNEIMNIAVNTRGVGESDDLLEILHRHILRLMDKTNEIWQLSHLQELPTEKMSPETLSLIEQDRQRLAAEIDSYTLWSPISQKE